MKYLILLLLFAFLGNCKDSTNPDGPETKDKTAETTGKEATGEGTTKTDSVASVDPKGNTETTDRSANTTTGKPTARPDIDAKMAKYGFSPLGDLRLYQPAILTGMCTFGPGYGNKDKFEQILINAKCAMLIAKRYAITGPNDESKDADDLTAYSYRLGILLYGEKTQEAFNLSNAFRREAKPSAVFGKVVLYQKGCNSGNINTSIARAGPNAMRIKKGDSSLFEAEFTSKFEKERLNYTNAVMMISMDPKCPEVTTKHLGIN
jgi:hypothetical protein